MKKKMITLAMVLFTFLSCSNKDYFDEGHVDLTPGYTIEEEDTYKVYTLNHPCLMHTNDDFQYVVGKIKTGAQPWGAAWEFLEQNQYTQLNENWTTDAPEILLRNSSGGNFKVAREPGLAAYYLALRWRIAEGLGEDTLSLHDALPI